jgi:hypothetical protein
MQCRRWWYWVQSRHFRQGESALVVVQEHLCATWKECDLWNNNIWKKLCSSRLGLWRHAILNILFFWPWPLVTYISFGVGMKSCFVKSEVHTREDNTVLFFWVVTPCTYQRFGETYCLQLQGSSKMLRELVLSYHSWWQDCIQVLYIHVPLQWVTYVVDIIHDAD